MDDTYDTTEINRDIQTGRAVYADKDKYENDEAYKASIDKYVREGFHLIFGTPDQPSEGGGSSGGGGGAEPLILTDTNGTLDKTWQEIYDAFANGSQIVVLFDNATLVDSVLSVYAQTSAETQQMEYGVGVRYGDYKASTSSDYPSGGGIS
jgi:hypothetical protein